MPAVKQELKVGDKLQEVNQILLSVTANPEEYLIEQHGKYNEIQNMLQKMYSVTVESDKDSEGNREILDDIIVEEMDEEQIWQQLELRNCTIMNNLIEKTANLMALRETKFEIHLKEPEDDQEDDEEDKLSEEEENINDKIDVPEVDGESPMVEDEDLFSPKPKRKRDMKRKSVVDDKFFKLAEMEQFLEAVEEKESRKQKANISKNDDDGINYFADDLGDNDSYESYGENSNPNYKDFFESDEETNENGMKNMKYQKDHFIAEGENYEVNEDFESKERKSVSNSEDEDEKSLSDKERQYNEKVIGVKQSSDSSETEDDIENAPKSSFEMKQSRMEQRIRDYEDEVLGEKPWQLKGEIQATNRPQNSLLEEVLEFESTVRPAPIITEETTRRLEDIIKQRIKDKAWDDVVRTVKPIHTQQDYRKLLVLDQEKSKESLAHIYEKEYQRELEKLNPNQDPNEPEEPKDHKEIRKLMRDLFVKLDALSNFHFTPKPVAPEPKIITNTPAVAMEEVAPVAVSDAKLLAPEEIFRGPKKELIGKSERSKTDKNRALRNKKSKQRAIHNALEAKDLQKQKMGIPVSKKEESAKLMKKLTKHRNVEKVTSNDDKGALKSSKAFFSKLQDQSTASNSAKPSKKKLDSKSLSAKKLKL